MSDHVMHRIRVGKLGEPPSREGRLNAYRVEVRIEAELGVTCRVTHDGMSFVIDWEGPQLPPETFDLLRPDVLPPR